jgi:hypothetical protein
MGLLNLALSVAEQEVEPFVAPIPDVNQVTVWTVQRGVPFRFDLFVQVGRERYRHEPGWFYLEAIDNRVRALRNARPHEYLAYLGDLPRFYVVVVHRLSAGTWLCIPWSAADVAQRGWLDGAPRPLYLVRDGVQAFDVVVARAMGDVLLYDTIDMRLDGCKARMARDRFPDLVLENPYRAAGALLFAYREALRQAEEERLRAIRERELEEQRAEMLRTTEGRLRWAVEFAGAEMNEWYEVGDGYSVTWTYDGHRHTARIGRDMHLHSAGICLGHAGQERRQNLTSTVAVIQEARRRHRYDMPRESWIH